MVDDENGAAAAPEGSQVALPDPFWKREFLSLSLLSVFVLAVLGLGLLASACSDIGATESAEAANDDSRSTNSPGYDVCLVAIIFLDVGLVLLSYHAWTRPPASPPSSPSGRDENGMPGQPSPPPVRVLIGRFVCAVVVLSSVPLMLYASALEATCTSDERCDLCKIGDGSNDKGCGGGGCAGLVIGVILVCVVFPCMLLCFISLACLRCKDDRRDATVQMELRNRRASREI